MKLYRIHGVTFGARAAKLTQQEGEAVQYGARCLAVTAAVALHARGRTVQSYGVSSRTMRAHDRLESMLNWWSFDRQQRTAWIPVEHTERVLRGTMLPRMLGLSAREYYRMLLARARLSA